MNVFYKVSKSKKKLAGWGGGGGKGRGEVAGRRGRGLV